MSGAKTNRIGVAESHEVRRGGGCTVVLLDQKIIVIVGHLDP